MPTETFTQIRTWIDGIFKVNGRKFITGTHGNEGLKKVLAKSEELHNSKGQANGIATLDENGKVPSVQLPEQSANIASEINNANTKSTPIDTDIIGLVDSENNFTLKKWSFLNIKASLKAYFDTIYTGGSGGGHEYSENGVSLPQRSKRNIITNGAKPALVDNSAEDATEEHCYFENQLDVDLSTKQDADILSYNSATDKIETQSSAPFTLIQKAPLANINANGQIVGAILPHGSSCRAWIKNETANEITGFVLTDGTNNYFAPVTVPASGKAVVDFDYTQLDAANDKDIYAAATTWNSGSVTAYCRFNEEI